MQWLVILIAGGVGSLARYYFAASVYQWLGKDFPYGILAVNILGCLLMGFLATMLVHKFDGGGLWRPTLLVGFLGGFTTFSSFSLDSFEMIQEGVWLKAIIYIILSVVLCLSATAIGSYVATRI